MWKRRLPGLATNDIVSTGSGYETIRLPISTATAGVSKMILASPTSSGRRLPAFVSNEIGAESLETFGLLFVVLEAVPKSHATTHRRRLVVLKDTGSSDPVTLLSETQYAA